MTFTRPTGEAPLDGPEPRNGTAPLNPASDDGAFNYWLDRMVRSRHQLVERLSLVFHDWWATRRDGVSTNAEMLNQTNIFRAHGLGSFRAMARAVTTDPAMLQFLDGMSNRRGAMNENYGRELMELFTLGADRGAYTETDVREIAKRAQRLDRDLRQRLDELALGRPGPLGHQHQDGVRQVRPLHVGGRGRARRRRTRCTRRSSSASCGRYFIPVPPDAATSAALERHYVALGPQIRPVLEAILRAPAVLRGPADGQAAGRLRWPA